MEQQNVDLIGQADTLYNEKRYAEALAIYQSLANHRVTHALCMLGIMYEYGQGVKQNYYEAARCYQEAATAGNVISMSNYGNMLYFGRGVRKNIPEARRYYRQAAELGHEEAQRSLETIEAKYEFAADGTIVIEGKKRSKWVVAILHFLFWNMLIAIFALFSLDTVSLMVVAGLILIALFCSAPLLILCKKALGGKMLIGFILILPIGVLLMPFGESFLVNVSIFSLLLLAVLQIKRDGIPAWNVLMHIPYDGRNAFVKFFDFASVYGEGEEFRADSQQTKTYRKQIKIATVVVVLSSVAAVCLMFIHGVSIDFTPNWNYFKSALAFPLWIVGFLLSLKYQVGSLVFGHEDSKGKFKKSNDVVDSMLGSIIYPLLMRFIVYPLLFALPIYYAIMVVVVILGVILPYVFALLMIASSALYYFKANSWLIGRQYRRILIPAFALLFICVYFTIYAGWVAG